MTVDQLRAVLLEMRSNAEQNMPTPRSIGEAVVKGKFDQALHNLKSREFRTGQVHACTKLLALIDGKEA